MFMGFFRDLIGGVVIMLIATAIGALQNSVRSKPVALLINVPRTGYADAASPGSSPQRTAGTHNGGQTLQEELPGTEPAGLISRDQLRAELDAGTTILVDARSESEFNEGHIPGALNIPYESFTEYFQQLTDLVPLESAVVCYCRSVTCDLSDHLAQELRLMGYENVRLYRGGWDEWQEAGYPADKP
jgi:rhodanese-related sulfurtransferase